MALSKEQIIEIKKQILKQIESWPQEKQENAINQIEAMNPEELEQFLIQNKLIGQENSESKESSGNQECIFCLILEGKVPTYKIDENKQAIATLEINPLSHGHSIIISKSHDKLASSAFTLASKIAKRIKTILKPDEVKIESNKVFNHEMINIIPIYNDKKLEKRKAEEKELILLQDKLKAKIKNKTEKKPKLTKQTRKNLEKAPIRIP